MQVKKYISFHLLYFYSIIGIFSHIEAEVMESGYKAFKTTTT
uniref:Uncharacterized protein n=1 Tax=Anopheles arabiensis TaxID=7173 RepID=A0A182IH34_ANOAR